MSRKGGTSANRGAISGRPGGNENRIKMHIVLELQYFNSSPFKRIFSKIKIKHQQQLTYKYIKQAHSSPHNKVKYFNNPMTVPIQIYQLVRLILFLLDRNRKSSRNSQWVYFSKSKGPSKAHFEGILLTQDFQGGAKWAPEG